MIINKIVLEPQNWTLYKNNCFYIKNNYLPIETNNYNGNIFDSTINNQKIELSLNELHLNNIDNLNLNNYKTNFVDYKKFFGNIKEIKQSDYIYTNSITCSIINSTVEISANNWTTSFLSYVYIKSTDKYTFFFDYYSLSANIKADLVEVLTVTDSSQIVLSKTGYLFDFCYYYRDGVKLGESYYNLSEQSDCYVTPSYYPSLILHYRWNFLLL